MGGDHHNANGASIGIGRLRAALGSRWFQALFGLFLIAALALESAALVRQAHAATLDVCASGCAYKSINDALAAASPGDTITVKAGTYGPNEPGATTPDTQITINKPINLVGSGAGKSIINDAPANQGKATAGVISITTPTTPGNVTISGFTIEGAIVNDQNDDGILMMTTDTRASDVITIKNNLFYGDTTLDPQLLADQTDSIYIYSSNATTNVTGNTFKGVFRAALIEGNPGPVNFTNNVLNLHALYDLSTSPPTLYFWAEGLLFLADSGANITSPQVITGNTFESYPGLGVGMDAGYSGGLVGALSNVSITSNVFDNQGVATDGGSPFDAADIYMHAFGTSNGSVTSTISGVKIKYNTFKMNSSSGHGYAIRFNGTIGGNNSIDHNALIGGGSSRPLAAINFVSPGSATGVSVTHNIITGFRTGLSSDALPSGAQVSASQNCIAGNSSAGATVAAGTAVVATNNWWGAASGPHNASTNPSGKGNGVSGNVTFKPYLTNPAAICAGPVTSKVVATPNPVAAHSSFTLTATVSDATTGGFSIASAQFNINGGQYYPMSAKDGHFNQVSENVTGHVAISGTGRFTVCVRGKDAFGNTGATSCALVTVLSATPTPSGTATPEATATTAASATDTPATGAEPTDTTEPSATNTPASTQTPVAAFNAGNSSLILLLIGILALLVIGAVILFFVLGRRRNNQA